MNDHDTTKNHGPRLSDDVSIHCFMLIDDCVMGSKSLNEILCLIAYPPLEFSKLSLLERLRMTETDTLGPSRALPYRGSEINDE